jgi:hypothetical protein
MGIGHRIFIVQDGGVRAIAQKTFDDFFMRREAALPQFSGKTIDVIAAFYEVKNRKPYRLIRLDSMRFKILHDGSIDEEQQHAVGRLIANRMSWSYEPEEPKRAPNVVDATKRFEDKQWEWHHPKIAAHVRKQILDGLFR